jgi:hypothetical protein
MVADDRHPACTVAIAAVAVAAELPVHDPLSRPDGSRAKDERRARRTVEEPELQQALLDLFHHSDGFALDDDGIEHRTHGPEFLEAPVVRDLADRMVEAADAIRRVLRL